VREGGDSEVISIAYLREKEKKKYEYVKWEKREL